MVIPVKSPMDGSNIQLNALPINTQIGTTYTLALTDAPATSAHQGIVEMNNSAANTLTVPPNSSVSFSVGTCIMVTQYGTGQTTIAPGSGVTLVKASSLTTRAQYSVLTLYYRGSDVWVVGGDMT